MRDIELRQPENLGNPPPDFIAKLESRWSQGNFVCVGLDSEYSQIPEVIKELVASNSSEVDDEVEEVIFQFNRSIIDATADLVCAYKPNAAFYEAQGAAGELALVRTLWHIQDNYPDIPVIYDAKRGDIGNTNLGYIEHAFNDLEADAITVSPFLGKKAMQPFLDRKDKGIIILAKTSNPGSDEFQNLLVGETQEPLYQVIARNVAETWNENGNCALVVGATYPQELERIRAVIGDMPILLPGIGAQGGEVESTVKAGKDSRGKGMIINSSRGIIFASKGENFADAARSATQQLSTEINRYR